MCAAVSRRGCYVVRPLRVSPCNTTSLIVIFSRDARCVCARSRSLHAIFCSPTLHSLFLFLRCLRQADTVPALFLPGPAPLPRGSSNHSLRMFGVGVPSANAQQHLDSYDSSLRAILVKSGLYDVHCLDPVHGVLKMLSSLSIVSPSNLIYTTPEFAEKIDAGVPDTAAVRAFVLMHSVGAFTWTNVADANQVKIDQSLVIGRFCMVVHYALDSARQSVANIMEG